MIDVGASSTMEGCSTGAFSAFDLGKVDALITGGARSAVVGQKLGGGYAVVSPQRIIDYHGYPIAIEDRTDFCKY